MQKLHKPMIGGHLRANQGLRNVALSARALGYDLMQIMLGENTSWQPYSITDDVASEFLNLTYGLTTYVHLPFIINPCDLSGRKLQFGRSTIRRYGKVAHNLKTQALVLHPGFKMELTEKEAYINFLRFFENFLREDDVNVLIETDAGSKNESAIGSLEFISDALNDLQDEKVLMCIDSCHLYARGVNLWDSETRKKTIGNYGEKIRLVHLNVPDPDVELGSNRDRHNCTFRSFHTNSEEMIRDLTGLWPVILERRSLSIQEQDVKYLREILGINQKEPLVELQPS